MFCSDISFIPIQLNFSIESNLINRNMLKCCKLIRDADVAPQYRFTGELKQLPRPCSYKHTSDLPLMRKSASKSVTRSKSNSELQTVSTLYIDHNCLTRSIELN